VLSRRRVALNIESGEIRYLVARGRRIVGWGGGPLPAGIVRQGSIADPDGVGAAIKALFAEKDLPRNGVMASLTGLRSAIRIIAIPKVKASLLEEAVRNESEREMPVSLDDLYLSRRPIAAAGPELQFLVIGVPRDILDAEVRCLGLAGIRPEALNLKPLALARAVNRRDAVIIDIEPDTFDLVVVADGVPALARTVVSRGEGAVFEDRLPQIADEFTRTVEFYNGSHRERPLAQAAPVVLTGLLADGKDTSDLVAAALARPVERFSPAGGFPPGFPSGRFAVNIGLARRQYVSRNGAGALSPTANPNVLPRKGGSFRMSPVRVLYPIAVAGLAALAIFLYQLQVDVGAEMEGIEAEIVSVNHQIDTMRDDAARISAAVAEAEVEIDRLEEDRMAMLDALSSSNMAESLLPALEAVPATVGISSITQTADGIELSGTADSESVVAGFVLALERTGVFSSVYLSNLSIGDGGSRVDFNIVGETAAAG